MKDDVGNFSKEMETVIKHLNETIAYECSFSCSMRPACTWGKGGERSRCDVTGPKSRLGGDSDFSPGRSRDLGGVGGHAVLRADGQSMGTVGQGCLQLGADAMLSPAMYIWGNMFVTVTSMKDPVTCPSWRRIRTIKTLYWRGQHVISGTLTLPLFPRVRNGTCIHNFWEDNLKTLPTKWIPSNSCLTTSQETWGCPAHTWCVGCLFLWMWL